MEPENRKGFDVTGKECPKCRKNLAVGVLDKRFHLACTGYPDCTYSRSLKKIDAIRTGINCPDCNNSLAIKEGRLGTILSCNGYPECKYMRPLTVMNMGAEFRRGRPPIEAIDCLCERCESPMVVHASRYGWLLHCSKYPTCNFREELTKCNDTSVPCQACDTGTYVKHETARGFVAYGCSNARKCKSILLENQWAQLNEIYSRRENDPVALDDL